MGGFDGEVMFDVVEGGDPLIPQDNDECKRWFYGVCVCGWVFHCLMTVGNPYWTNLVGDYPMED